MTRTTSLAVPVGVNLTSVGVPASWWLESAARVAAAGYAGVWAWDHFVSWGRVTDPLLECWTTLSAVAATTQRLQVGSFVTNVMNRHPAVLANMVMTVADIAPGRVELGIGIGGHPAEHVAYGMPFPAVPERVARLEESVAIIRALFTGGPVDFAGRYYQLSGAHAAPIPLPVPRISVSAESPAGARLAARIGDAWITFEEHFDRLLPVYLEALAAAGRERSEVSIIVGVDVPRGDAAAATPLLRDLPAATATWQQRGVDELVLHWIHPDQLEAVLAASERAAA